MHALEHLLFELSNAPWPSEEKVRQILRGLASMTHDEYEPVKGIEAGESTPSSIEQLNERGVLS